MKFPILILLLSFGFSAHAKRRVVNTRNGLPICTKQVYETHYDEKLESDVQDNFTTELKVDGKNLIINSEKLAPIQKPIANFCD